MIDLNCLASASESLKRATAPLKACPGVSDAGTAEDAMRVIALAYT